MLIETNVLFCAILHFLVLKSASFICGFLNGVWGYVYLGIFNIFYKPEQKPDMALHTHHFLLRNYSVQ